MKDKEPEKNPIFSLGTTRLVFLGGFCIISLLILIYAIGILFNNIELERLKSLEGFILWFAPLVFGLKLGDALIEYKEEESDDKVDIALGKKTINEKNTHDTNGVF